MKQLIESNILHKSIENLKLEIDYIDSFINQIIENKTTVSVYADFEAQEEHCDEEKNVVEEVSNTIQGLGFMTINNPVINQEQISDFELTISEQEALIMFGNLRVVKTKKRDSLIKQFNKLGLKLKV